MASPPILGGMNMKKDYLKHVRQACGKSTTGSITNITNLGTLIL